MSKSIDEQIDELFVNSSLVYKDDGDWRVGLHGDSEATYAVDDMKEAIKSLIAQAEKEATQTVYDERNQLVAVLSKIYSSHLALHDPSDKEWEDDWRNIVCIHTPKGQATWHIHDEDTKYFGHLFGKRVISHWDGHTTEEKYDRLNQLREEQHNDHTRI